MAKMRPMPKPQPVATALGRSQSISSFCSALRIMDVVLGELYQWTTALVELQHRHVSNTTRRCILGLDNVDISQVLFNSLFCLSFMPGGGRRG